MLALMSVVTWIIILIRITELWVAKLKKKRFARIFWQTPDLHTVLPPLKIFIRP